MKRDPTDDDASFVVASRRQSREEEKRRSSRRQLATAHGAAGPSSEGARVPATRVPASLPVVGGAARRDTARGPRGRADAMGRKNKHQHATKKKPLGPSDAVEEMSLRDAVEAFASEHDVTFAPKPGRIVEGLQAYAFGSITVTIDSAKQMLLAQVEGRWAPVSLDALLERHKAKARKASKTF